MTVFPVNAITIAAVERAEKEDLELARFWTTGKVRFAFCFATFPLRVIAFIDDVSI